MPVLSLDELKEKMISWKRQEIYEGRRKLDLHSNAVEAARNAIHLVVTLRPHLDSAPGAEYAENTRTRLWRLISGAGGAYHEDKRRRAEMWVMSLDDLSARHFIQLTANWVRQGAVEHEKRLEEEIARAKRELRFFEGVVDGLAGSAAGGSSSSTDALTCDGGQCASTCVICLEQPEAEVGVLPCGHCAGCGPCVRQWVTQSEACPTCRRSCKIHEVSFVDLKKGAEPREEGAAAAAGPSAAERRAARVEAEVVEVNAAEGLAWGSKPR